MRLGSQKADSKAEKPARREPLRLTIEPSEWSRFYLNDRRDLYCRIIATTRAYGDGMVKHHHDFEADPATGLPPTEIAFDDGCVVRFAIRRETWEPTA